MIDNSNFDRRKYKYCYSVTWANYLMLHGVICRGTGISKSTGKYFWAFNYDECQPVYDLIEQRKKEEQAN